jgi:hypothetical protein
MANQNFVVHNGLTVGPLTIDAASGNISTTGYISGIITAAATSDQILNGASNIRVTADWVNVSVKGSNVLSVGTLFTSLNTGYLNVGGNVLATTGSFGAINSTGFINTSANISTAQLNAGQINTSGNVLAVNVLSNFITADDAVIGNLSAAVFGNVGSTYTGASINLSANVLAAAGTFNALTVNGGVTSTGFVNTSGNISTAQLNAGQINTTGNVLATAGVFNGLTVNGNETVTGFLNVTGNVLTNVCEAATVETTGMVRANSTVAASSAITGAIVTAGGIGVLKDSVFGGNVTIDGNLFVNGNTSVFNTNNLSISDSMIYLADDNTADVLDIGLISAFTNPGYQHTGFVRDSTDGIWKLFANVVAEPTTTVDFTNATYSTLKTGNVIASVLTGTSLVLGAGAISTVGAITSTGLINTTGNVLATAGVFNALTVNGGVTSTGFINTSGNVSAAVHTGGAVSLTGLINTSGNVLATAGTFNALTVNGNVVVTSAYAVPSANAASSLGTSATRWNFVYGVSGNFLSVNANYADLAENYLSDAEYAPGTVLMFGGDQEVTECMHDMCSRVAGVVSTNPGYLMNQGLEGEHTVELALTGRVPTKVTGTVQKGDMMVSAGNGRARAEANPRVGSVIGKALENSEGDAVIEVVVGKH